MEMEIVVGGVAGIHCQQYGSWSHDDDDDMVRLEMRSFTRRDSPERLRYKGHGFFESLQLPRDYMLPQMNQKEDFPGISERNHHPFR